MYKMGKKVMLFFVLISKVFYKILLEFYMRTVLKSSDVFLGA